MNRRISTKRSVANTLMGAAALLGVWATATMVRDGEPRDQRGAAAVPPATVQEVLRCERTARPDKCLAGVLRVTDTASGVAPLRKPLEGEQV